jgi:hypothetical protein
VDTQRTIKALTFDTGGTVLDWHGGVTAALARVGARRQVERDWAEITRICRRRALQRMTGSVSPDFNIDDVHRNMLQELVIEHELTTFTVDDREEIWRAWHELDAWRDAAQGAGPDAPVQPRRVADHPQHRTDGGCVPSERDRLGLPVHSSSAPAKGHANVSWAGPAFAQRADIAQRVGDDSAATVVRPVVGSDELDCDIEARIAGGVCGVGG